jgi:hypothetical protein
MTSSVTIRIVVGSVVVVVLLAVIAVGVVAA